MALQERYSHDSGALKGMTRLSVPLAEHGQVGVTDTAHASVSQGPAAETVGLGVGHSPGPRPWAVSAQSPWGGTEEWGTGSPA